MINKNQKREMLDYVRDGVDVNPQFLEGLIYHDEEGLFEGCSLEKEHEMAEKLFQEEKRKLLLDEQQKKEDEAFYTDARHYSHPDLDKFPLARARVLGEHYFRFSHRGEQPLVTKKGNLSGDVMAKESPFNYVGFVFHKVYSGVKKRLGYD